MAEYIGGVLILIVLWLLAKHATSSGIHGDSEPNDDCYDDLHKFEDDDYHE